MIKRVLSAQDVKDLQADPRALEFWAELIEKGEKIVLTLPNAEEPVIKPRSNCQWWQWMWCK